MRLRLGLGRAVKKILTTRSLANLSKEWVNLEQALSGDLSKTREGISGNVSLSEADEEEEDYIRAQRIFAANSMQVSETEKH